jgi:SMI1 / KNR4 family (SUKH-1)
MTQLNRPYIALALESLRSLGSGLFGAEFHGFELNPKLSEAVVTAFEQTHGIHLPPDYRSFLTSIGDGGAGPFYGVFPLGKMDDNFSLRDWREGDIGVLSAPFPFNEPWNDLSGKPDDDQIERDETEYWKQMEAFESRYWSVALVNGAFPICHQGCALRILLVVCGDQAGDLWEDRRAEDGGLTPLRLDDGTPANFSDWYREWLGRCLKTLGSPEAASE